MRFETKDKAIAVTRQTTENISKLLPIKRYSVGSVEGVLEAINLHKKARIIVYHAITNKGISCEFEQGQWMHFALPDIGTLDEPEFASKTSTAEYLRSIRGG